MTTFVIGDLHGCLTPLRHLLDRVQYAPGSDKLWFVGDLVNRGPQSLETLRFVRSLGDDAVCVLGNHDLHLLAVINGLRRTSGKDTLDDILRADDLPELTDWLRHRPLLHYNEELNVIMVHAGIHINTFTRMRFCTKKGELELSETCAPHKAPKGLVPWYAVPNRQTIDCRILFGHWSSHPAFAVSNVIPLDRGAVWGGSLAALALETGVTTTVDCAG